MVQFDFMFLAGAAISVVGVVEYIKGFWPAAPAWAWRLSIPPACVAVAVAGGGNLSQIATNSFLLLAVAQIGYPLLIQLPGVIIKKFQKGLE